jgi:hypothetical protein
MGYISNTGRMSNVFRINNVNILDIQPLQ